MSLLNRLLGAVSDFNRNLQDHEVRSVPQQFRGGAVYTDPLIRYQNRSDIGRD